ncbi:NAD-dependent formate dehydrogenase alpha subunit [hydrothermal vent metagenome]|uniref:NAD-dependent formate dehydrogenase alpha subunit n=1 Tax=hydrothermal vent metagenome TaxID=652676 RepID=A0A3B0U419_9ZZZZ
MKSISDLGTPASTSEKLVSLTINGANISVPEGTSVLRAARGANIDIPSLCASQMLAPHGSCRLCVVEINGTKDTPASCTTPVADGMEVTTETDRLARIRRGIMELYISDHPLDCLTCASSGDCELQDMAARVGLRQVRYPADGQNHLDAKKDTSNPYFTFDPAKCILCSRCVRACDEVQGSLALTVKGRAFDATLAAGLGNFFTSECVSCGLCVDLCPTDALIENTIIEHGQPDREIKTTCAYCGVGCSFVAQMQGNRVVRMIPDIDGKANHGHSCVKGRFAWGYATHPDRITTPLVRDSIDQDWREVDFDEAIAFAARRLKNIQQKYGKEAIGGITSSRCTNEEVWLVQKMIRAAFGNNNVDTCARVCHSPTGYGLKQTFGESAGTQDFDSVSSADVIMVIGSNPTEAHPVFGAAIKARLRQGAKLIVVDPRKIELVGAPHVRADFHLALMPGTNVAMINAFAHVVVSEKLFDRDFIAARCDSQSFDQWCEFALDEVNSPENVSKITGVDAADIAAAARLFATGGNGAIYYGLGVTEHSQGSTMVMGLANLAMATGNIGRAGVGVNPMRGQNNVQGACDMGSFPHEFSGYRPVGDDDVRSLFEQNWGVSLNPKPGLRIPNMFDQALAGAFKGFYVQGEDVAQSDPNIHHVEAALRAMDTVIVQDLFLNETCRFAHVFLPGTSFLEKDGTFINAERRINRVRPVMNSKSGLSEWQVTAMLSSAMGYKMDYNSAKEIMDEIAALTPTMANVSFDYLDKMGSLQWPVTDQAPMGTPVMHTKGFTRGKGMFILTEFTPTTERANRKFPLLLTTGRILSQYNVGQQTRRTRNMAWAERDILEIHKADAEMRGIHSGDLVAIRSRKGETTLIAKISERVQPGVVYTTFHHPETGTNIVTTELSDWATDCPEYKVTAVEISPANHLSDWQNARSGQNADPVAK